MPSFPIQLKRNGTAAATPSSLLHGEVALNYADGKLFWKDASNVIQSFTFQAYALSSHTHAASDITSGTFDAARIANDSITYAKLQNVSATDRLLGRSSAGAGDVEEITCTSFGRSLIDDADAATARSTLSVQPTASPAFTGAATVSSGNIGVSTSVGSAPTNGTAHALLLTSTTTAAVNVGPAVFFKGQTGNNTADYGFAGIQGVKDSSSSQNYAGALVFFVQTAGGAAALSEAMRCRTDHSTGAVLTVMAGQLQVTAGSASACGVAFSGDTNTGLAQIGGADTLGLVVGGTEALRVASDGDVGIGITSPGSSYRMHLYRGASDCVLAVQGLLTDAPFNGSGKSALQLDVDGKGGFAWQCDATSGTRVLKLISNSGYGASSADRMSVSSDGVVTMNDVYSVTVGATNRDLFIDNTGKLGYVSSIRASKTGIAAIDDVSWMRDLTPVSFHYRKRNADGTYSDEPDGTLDYGLIAEDVEPVAPELCFYDVVEGEPQLRGVHYSKLITPMLRYIQQLEARIAALEERLNHA